LSISLGSSVSSTGALPGQPQRTYYTVPESFSVEDMLTSGGYLYVASGSSGFRIFRMSPTPQQIAAVAVRVLPNDIKVLGHESLRLF
jgi:hypothetical protein